MSKIIARHKPPSISPEDEKQGIIYPAEVVEGWKNDHTVFKTVKKLELDLAKILYEFHGESYFPTENEVLYENDVYNSSIPIYYNYTVDWGTPDWASLGDPSNKRDAVDAFILFFRHEIGVQDYVTAGIMGCLQHESGLKSHIVAKGEKDGSWSSFSSACGPSYGAGLFANTGGNKFECQDAIGGYAWEAQPMSTQMQVTFSTSDGFKSLLEVIQNYLPWKPDIKEIIKERLTKIKEIKEEDETGKNQWWPERDNELSELEELAVNQACDCWSLCAEHGTYPFSDFVHKRKAFPGPGPFRPIIARVDPRHQVKRRFSAIQYYKYMKRMISFSALESALHSNH